MARLRQFDKDIALDAAVQTFWRLGYEAASVRALCEAMGIQPGSFYAAFGDKDTCFRLALQRYIEARSARGEVGPHAIAAWFDACVDLEGRPSGCLLVSSAIALRSLDTMSQAVVTASLQAIEDFFWRCLGDRPHAREDAALLGAAVAGIHVLAKGGADSQRLRRIADRALTLAGIDEQSLNKRKT